MALANPRRVAGWMGRRSLKWLKRKGGRRPRVIEIGSWMGRSTSALARRNRGLIVCVDTWDGVPDDPAQHELYAESAGDVAYRRFSRTMAKELAAGSVRALRMSSEEAAAVIRAEIAAGCERYDMVFIDGDHRYEAVRRDILLYQRFLVAGGLLSGHDYGKERYPGVTRAVDELAPEAKHGPGSIWRVTR